ncbi:uncharacterized protein K02A2.6-like isoform X1 [Amphibalanus amphitrite]|uniref:uncharacterized protein K02A2.6-like isoform X1 n=1 Tax=Amphibalanus amphitrite TaxID=1232801 RepID=UPI001C91CB0F|nr:uncharacterized protein K02A2.6-like isoform X1 [Amphibalanus amphitrite]
MSSLPVPPPYQPGENFDRWLRGVEYYMIASGITSNQRKSATVLTFLGLEIQDVVRTLPQPPELDDAATEYQVLTAKLQAYYQPRVNATYERSVLHDIYRKDGESFEAFVTRLRLQADRCQFDYVLLEQTVLQCAVAHARSTELQRKFFDKPDLTLAQALEIARHFETTRSQLEDLNRSTAAVQYVTAPCHRCLSTTHDASACPYRTRECFACHRVGHSRAACPQRARQAEPSRRRGQSRAPSASASSPASRPLQGTAQSGNQSCSRCLSRRHGQDVCPFRDQICYRCQRPGHTRVACQNRPAQSSQRPAQPQPAASRPSRQRRAHYVSGSSPPATEVSADLLFTVRSSGSVQPLHVEVSLNGSPVTMEVDTGASCSMMSRAVFEKAFLQSVPDLAPYRRRLYTYTGEEVPVAGVAQVVVAYRDQSARLPLIIVDNDGPTLMGRDWLATIRLDWPALFGGAARVDYVAVPGLDLENELRKLVPTFPELFSPGLGKYTPRQVSLQVDDSKPRFYKHRPPPLALKGQIEEELERQVKLGILEPVTTSQWAAPIVPVKKRDGSIRLCGSYDLTVNVASALETYPLPRVEELFAVLSGGAKFTKIDLKEAYLQLELDEQSRKFTTVSTHKGLFQATRLVFGIKSAVAVFQREMENLLAGIPHTAIYLDDICVTGRTPAEHLANVREVLRRLAAAGLKINAEKTVWVADEVQYLGHRITAAGIRPSAEKVRAVSEAREPASLQELRAFLGLVQYYSRFLPRLSTVAAPMYELEKKDVKWAWGERQKVSFQETKDLLAVAPVLVHYQQDKPLVLTADASPYGVAAVLSHPDPQTGADQPIAFASRSLTPAERNYSQLDREALAIIFGVSKYHQYVYGRKFVIKTDHKPLLGLLAPGKCLPMVVSPRVLRWKLTLTGYDFDLQFVPGREIANADGLSRLPLPDTDGEFPVPADVVNLMEEMSHLVTAQQLAIATRRDPVLSAVYRPWQRLHIDYAGPMEGGHWLLIIVDSYSKWVDVHITTSTSAAVTIDRLRQTFACHGLPLVLVSDNATAFASSEFSAFLKGNGIKHLFSPPRHPSSNGQAEAMVKVVKNALRNRTGSLQTRLHRFLLSYRTSPHSSTGRSPAELLFGRPLRTRLDVCKPSLRETVELKQHAWKNARDSHCTDRQFMVGDPVYVCLIPGPGAPWVPGVVTAAGGQICTVQLADGRIFTRHRDHVRPRVCALPSLVPGQADPAQPVPETTTPAHSARAPSALEALCAGAPAAQDASSPATATSEVHPALLPESVAAAPAPPGVPSGSAPVVPPGGAVGTRRSTRVRRAPSRYSAS